MNVNAVLINKATKQIVKYGPYPNEDITPLLPEVDIDPSYEWLIQYIPYAEPDYDSRLYLLVTNLPDLEYLNIFPNHSLYPGIKEYKITYTLEKRSTADIKISIENLEKEANNLIWSEATHKDKMMLMLAASNKKASGQTLNETEQTYLDEMLTITTKIAKNTANKLLLFEAITANQEPNIELGWERI